MQRKHLRNELLFALVILVVLLVWARAASMVHVFFPMDEDLGMTGWLECLGVGSAVGAVFAAGVFPVSAFSLPLLLDRCTDAVTGALTSIAAVLKNKAVLLLWGMLIVVLVTVGFATAYLGLVVVLPWIGHAPRPAYPDPNLPPRPQPPAESAHWPGSRLRTRRQALLAAGVAPRPPPLLQQLRG